MWVIRLFSLKEESKTIKILLLASCSTLFFLILISIFHYGNSTLLGNFYEPNNDDVKFIRSAWNLAQTGVYSYHRPPEATAFMMPGLSYILSFLMILFGKFGGITAFRVIQAVVQVLSLLLMFFIARKLFNSKVGIVAVILDVLCIWEIWIPNLVLTETFFKFFVLCLIYFSLLALDENKVKYYVLGGLFLGFSALFRPTIATYPILILIMWIIKKVKFKDALKYTLIVAGVFCIVMSPWWIRNYSIFHKFIPFSLATGNPMLQGTFISYDQTTKDTDGLDYSNYDTKDPSLTEIERNDMEIALSKYRIKTLFPKQPGKFIYWYTISKSWIQINCPFYWGEIFGVSSAKAKSYNYLLLMMGALGSIFYFMDKNKNKLAILPIITVIYFVIVYLPFYTMGRYFYPAMPYVIIFSAYFIVNTFNKFKAKIA
jgi:4-amino-4-deoxy-L-arabinose transferase-like glycosyltransferase